MTTLSWIKQLQPTIWPCPKEARERERERERERACERKEKEKREREIRKNER